MTHLVHNLYQKSNYLLDKIKLKPRKVLQEFARGSLNQFRKPVVIDYIQQRSHIDYPRDTYYLVLLFVFLKKTNKQKQVNKQAKV